MHHARDVARPEVDAHRIPGLAAEHEVAARHRDKIARRIGSLRQHGELVRDHVVAQTHRHAAGRVTWTQRRRTRHRDAVRQRAAPHDASIRIVHLRLGGGRRAVPVRSHTNLLSWKIRELVRARAVQPRFAHQLRDHLCHTRCRAPSASRQPPRGLPRPPLEQHPLGRALAARRVAYGTQRNEAPVDALAEALAQRARYRAHLAGYAHRLVARIDAVLLGHERLRLGPRAREGIAAGAEVAEADGSGASGHHRGVREGETQADVNRARGVEAVAGAAASLRARILPVAEIVARQRHARPFDANRRRRDPAATVRLHELHRQHGVRLVCLRGEREHRLAVAEEAHAARGMEHVPAHERHGREMEAVAFPPEEAACGRTPVVDPMPGAFVESARKTWWMEPDRRAGEFGLDHLARVPASVAAEHFLVE